MVLHLSCSAVVAYAGQRQELLTETLPKAKVRTSRLGIEWAYLFRTTTVVTPILRIAHSCRQVICSRLGRFSPGLHREIWQKRGGRTLSIVDLIHAGTIGVEMAALLNFLPPDVPLIHRTG